MKMFMLLAFLCIGFLLLAKIAVDYAGDVVIVVIKINNTLNESIHANNSSRLNANGGFYVSIL